MTSVYPKPTVTLLKAVGRKPSQSPAGVYSRNETLQREGERACRDPASSAASLDPCAGSSPLDPCEGSSPLDPCAGSCPLDPCAGSCPLDPCAGSCPLDRCARSAPLTGAQTPPTSVRDPTSCVPKDLGPRLRGCFFKMQWPFLRSKAGPVPASRLWGLEFRI